MTLLEKWIPSLAPQLKVPVESLGRVQQRVIRTILKAEAGKI